MKLVLAWRRVSIMTSTTFQSVSRRPTPQVYVFPLGINTRMVYPNYRGISPVIDIYWTISAICIHLPYLEGFLTFSPR